MRKDMLGLSFRMTSMLGDISLWSADSTTDLNIAPGSADFRLLEHMFLKSRVQHRLSYRCDEVCETPQLEIVSMTFVPVKDDLRKKYETQCQEQCRECGRAHCRHGLGNAQGRRMSMAKKPMRLQRTGDNP